MKHARAGYPPWRPAEVIKAIRTRADAVAAVATAAGLLARLEDLP
ncbi:hypothetical protein [Streptomyces wuyuanensis]